MNLFIVAVCSAFAVVLGLAQATPMTAGFPLPPEADVLVSVTSGHGAGVYLGNGNFLTAAHVVKDEKEVLVDGVPVDVLWTDEKRDVALLHSDKPTTRVAAVKNCDALTIGQDVTAVGQPADMGRTISRGYVAAPDQKRAFWEHALVVVMAVYGGNSGGPVYDDRLRLVGIVVGQLQGTSFSMIVPLNAVCKVLP